MNRTIYLKYISSFFITLMLSVPAIFIISGCSDDIIDIPGMSGEYPEGETQVTFSLDFEPFSAGSISTDTRSLPGKTMDKLDDLCVIAYDQEGDLMEGFPIAIGSEHDLVVESQKRENEDAANGVTAENYTGKATFKLTVPYGSYYLYCLSNLGSRDKNGNLVTSTYSALQSGTLGEAAATREGLLNYKTSWDETNPMNNFEMLGYFSNKKSTPPVTGILTNDVRVSIDHAGIEVHSWLRRCASKVTIDFDGSGLRDNVQIFIRKATIHDIPKQCALGKPNIPQSESEIYTYKNSHYRPEGAGDYIQFGDGDDFYQWPYISKGRTSLPTVDGNIIDRHDENAESLFLYENMQGDSDEPRDKEQFPDSDGLVVGTDEMKDNVPYGSYIEIEGYYISVSNQEVSQGRIWYRFMLGKDALKNFDVERNYHLKLTMCPRGNGNDVDWHIEYDRETGFEWKDPYYVSYVYNHDSTIHFKYTPPEGRVVVKVEAEIIGNNWWADDPSTKVLNVAKDEQNCLFSNEEGDPLNASFTRNKYPDDYPEVKLRGKTKYLGNGFLSLRVMDFTTLNYEDASSHGAYDTNSWASHEDNKYMNDRFFYGVSDASGGIDQSYREYKFNPTTGQPAYDPTNKGREGYTVDKNPDGSLRFNIPVFTRAKNLVKQTAYSGNNVYEGSTRTAYVKITVHLDNGHNESQVIRVLQVPRISNPKGIYRKSGNNEDFNVTLTELPSATSTHFKPLESDGPWLAEVIGDDNFISLNGRQTIKGGSGSVVNFNVKFNKMNRDKTVRNAIIRIRYHNQSCVHLIFVRQGYSAIRLSPNGPLWHTTNLIYSKDGTVIEADDPRDEGSLFKFGNLDTPIDAAHNVNPWNYGTIPEISSFQAATKFYKLDENGDLSSTADMSWSDIKGDMTVNMSTTHNIPTMEDIRTIYNEDKMSQGFGVLYADGADQVQMAVEDAYGYYRRDTAPNASKKGMRGVFAYFWDNKVDDPYDCHNVFFPIGRSGYGHRRANDHSSGGKDGSKDGTLRYSAGRDGEMPTSAAMYQPQFYDLYRREGAIYWGASPVDTYDVTGSSVIEAVALDLNYYTFDVNILAKSNLQKHSQWSGCSDNECIDACFLKAVGAQTRR